MQAIIYPSNISGKISVPPSKSCAHRAIICAALASGKSTLRGFKPSRDMEATIGAMQQLGATISCNRDTLEIQGASPLAIKSARTVDCIESGSTLRFAIPIFALCGEEITFIGQGRLMERPQDIYSQLMRENGADFHCKNGKISIKGGLVPREYTLRGDVSSQFFTGLLLALPLLKGNSELHIIPPLESRSYIDITLDILARFGIRAFWKSENCLAIPGNQRYLPADYTIEGDWSQAAFFYGGIFGGCKLELENLNPESLQGDRAILGFIDKIKNQSNPLLNIEDCPDLGPILAVICGLHGGTSHITGAGRLRIKESDRILAMERELAKLGVSVTSDRDSMTIVSDGVLRSNGEAIDSHNDHRIVMSMAIAALFSDLPLTINKAEAVAKSYPDFFEDLRRLGGKIELR